MTRRKRALEAAFRVVDMHFEGQRDKRQLCAAYDVFVADQRVLPMLPPLLGKTFFKKRKLPVAVSTAVLLPQ